MPDPEPDLTREQEAQLRRLLAEARHGEPIPVDVANRLDRVLEQLAEEEPDALPASGRLHDELAARRRRRVTALLVAAAAVVVVGVGIGQVTKDTASDEASPAASGSAADAQDSVDGLASGGAELATKPSPGESAPSVAQGPKADTKTSGQLLAPVRLSERGFAREAVRFARRPGYRAVDAQPVSGADLSSAEAFMCPAADWGEGKLLAALYDGVPTVLAYRPANGATQTVDLLRCGTGEVLRSTVLARP
ncbi:hypothetical protein BH11ACT8_BH11ACT8_14800 [soil metagenome]